MTQNFSQSKTEKPVHPSSTLSEINQPRSQFTILQFFSLALLLLLYLILALALAYLAPLTTGPDELAHYEYVRFIADHGRLPLNNEERQQASYKSDQPPLYHLIVALPASLVDPTGPPFLKRVNDHPRRQLIERTRHAWGLYNTQDERWPYRAEVLRWHIGRWVAILFGAATVAVTFFMARDVFSKLHLISNDPLHPPGDRRLETEDRLSTSATNNEQRTTHHTQRPWLFALGAAALVAFIPRFTLTGSMLNYETTEAFFSTLFLWVLIRLTTYDLRFTINNSQFTIHNSQFTIYPLLLGLLAGLAILTKLSALVLPLEAAIGLWLIITATQNPEQATRNTQQSEASRWDTTRWKLWLRLVLITILTTLIVLSFWFGFILYQFNTVAQDGLWVGLLRPLVAADSSDATTNQLLSFLSGGQAGFTGAIENLESGPPWEWAIIFFRTFWMVGIENVQPLASVGLIIALALCLLAAAGLLLGDHRVRSLPVGPPAADRRPTTDNQQWQPADYQSKENELHPVPNNQPPREASNLQPPISLLLLHLFLPFILPLLRYTVTFSLADTAQGRHVLFMAAPAFAILLVWGLMNLTHSASRFTFHVSRFIPLLPGLFVLVWTGVHLSTMTWAYNPPLPVSTLPEAKTQAAQPLNQPLNKFVALIGYTSQVDPASRTLRLDLIWQATAVSQVDYLTEASLIDAEGQTQALWLGYSAGGRYPSRAWDAGDIVRDTAWLPIAGLKPGTYQLNLNLLPTSQNYPPEQAVEAVALTKINLPNPALRVFNKALPFTDQAQAAAGYSIWRNGEALLAPQVFNYRETVMVTLSPLLPDQQRTVRMVGPNNELSFAPLRELNNTALFIVGPDWPTGDYHLQITVKPAGQAEAQGVNSDVVLSVVDRWDRQFAEPPISRRVEANFANQVKLLGYDLGTNRAEPGGGIPLTLYWQGLDWMGNDYTIFTKLLAADGTVHGGRDRLPREGYRTLYWAPGEIVTDPFGVPVEADAPEGVYYINVGLYKQVGQQAVSLPLLQDGQPVDVTSINIGPIKVGGSPPGLTLETAQPDHPLDRPFGDPTNVTLLGYDLDNCQLSRANCQLKITLYWRSESPLPLDYTTFVHLRSAGGDMVAQKDQPPLNGVYPTSLWDPGEIIADTIDLPLPAALPAGPYQIVVGLYDFQTGQRLTVPGNPANEVQLTDVEIR